MFGDLVSIGARLLFEEGDLTNFGVYLALMIVLAGIILAIGVAA